MGMAKSPNRNEAGSCKEKIARADRFLRACASPDCQQGAREAAKVL